jgi:hypothetical protein
MPGRAHLLGGENAQHHDLGLYAGRAQDPPLLDRGHRQLAGSFREQPRGHRHRAVAVGVGLDDRQEVAPGERGYRMIVGGQPVQVHPRRHDPPALFQDRQQVADLEGRRQLARHSRFSKRVNSLMKASLTVPVGPLRCLPMMISAMPRFSSVGLYSSSR